MWLENEVEKAKKNHPWRWKWEGLKLDFGEWRYGKMKPTIKKVIDIIHDLFRIGKTTAKDLQISGDVAMAKRVKKIIDEKDTPRLRKIVGRGDVIIDGFDIYEIIKHDTFRPAVIVSSELMVNYIIMKKIIRRYKRREG